MKADLYNIPELPEHTAVDTLFTGYAIAMCRYFRGGNLHEMDPL